jgi:hypothetical protein
MPDDSDLHSTKAQRWPGADRRRWSREPPPPPGIIGYVQVRPEWTRYRGVAWTSTSLFPANAGCSRRTKGPIVLQPPQPTPSAEGRRLFRAVSLLVLAAYCGACTGWQVQSAAPAQTLSDTRYTAKTVRLTIEGHGRVYLRHPTVTGDSVSGAQGDAPATFALADVKEVATKYPKPVNTVVLIAGSLLIVGGGIAAIAIGNSLAGD